MYIIILLKVNLLYIAPNTLLHISFRFEHRQSSSYEIRKQSYLAYECLHRHSHARFPYGNSKRVPWYRSFFQFEIWLNVSSVYLALNSDLRFPTYRVVESRCWILCTVHNTHTHTHVLYIYTCMVSNQIINDDNTTGIMMWFDLMTIWRIYSIYSFFVQGTQNTKLLPDSLLPIARYMWNRNNIILCSVDTSIIKSVFRSCIRESLSACQRVNWKNVKWMLEELDSNNNNNKNEVVKRTKGINHLLIITDCLFAFAIKCN